MPVGFDASADFIPCQNLNAVNICQLTDQDLNEILQGQRPETAVEFSAQTVLPLSLFLKGDILNLVEVEETFGTIEIKQTFTPGMCRES